MKAIDSIWFNDIGIVKGKDEVTGTIKFYIGHVLGLDQEMDEALLLKNGVPVNKQQLINFLED